MLQKMQLFLVALVDFKSIQNFIVFSKVGDGMSFATIAAGRILKGQKKGKSGEETEMIFESFPNFGLSKTYNIDKQVPDSAGTGQYLQTFKIMYAF